MKFSIRKYTCKDNNYVNEHVSHMKEQANDCYVWPIDREKIKDNIKLQIYPGDPLKTYYDFPEETESLFVFCDDKLVGFTESIDVYVYFNVLGNKSKFITCIIDKDETKAAEKLKKYLI